MVAASQKRTVPSRPPVTYRPCPSLERKRRRRKKVTKTRGFLHKQSGRWSFPFIFPTQTARSASVKKMKKMMKTKKMMMMMKKKKKRKTKKKERE